MSIVTGFMFTLVVSVIGVRALLTEYSLQMIRNDITTALKSGDYAAALGHLTDLEADVGSITEIEAERKLATTLLIAAANYEKAKLSADQGEWFDVRALLRDSGAVDNESFLKQREATALLSFAEERIRAIETSTATEIAGLEKTTVKEKQRSKSLQTELKMTIEQRNQTANVLDSTKDMLEKSNLKVVESAAEIEKKKELLREEQEKVSALAAQAARERLEKFLNEISAYRASLHDADSYITLALNEIKEKKDVSALLYISQAKTLFDDVYGKAAGLRGRAEDNKKEWAVRIVSASSEFLTTVKNLRNAVIFVEEQESEDFRKYLKNAEEARTRASTLVAEVQVFVDQNK